MTDYAAVLTANYPDAEWTLDGDTYDGLTWIGPGDKPTQAELDTAWPQVQYDRQVTAVENAHRARLPELSVPQAGSAPRQNVPHRFSSPARKRAARQRRRAGCRNQEGAA